jgi:membrane fusion protein, multidrug efflux system
MIDGQLWSTALASDFGMEQTLVDSQIGKARRGRQVTMTAALLGILAIGGAYWYSTRASGQTQAAGPAVRAAVPVRVAAAARQDIPIYLTGLGTVQAILTVGIHSVVDGTLQQVLFTEGQDVKKGDPLVEIDSRPYQLALEQAQGQLAHDQALLHGAELDLARYKALVATNALSKQQYDAQDALVRQYQGTIISDQAQVDAAKLNIAYCHIVAPNDGRLGVRLVDPGNIVHAADAGSIATLVSTQPTSVVFTLPVRSLDDVRQAMAGGAVEVVAYDQDNQKALSTGTLMLVDNVIDQNTSQFRLKATFANADERLWAGEFVNARVLLETRRNVIAVPSTAVQRGPHGLFTWVVGENNTATVRPIEVGPTAGDLTIIASGVSEGDRVVTEGQFKLEPDAPVTLAPPSATAGSAGTR